MKFLTVILTFICFTTSSQTLDSLVSYIESTSIQHKDKVIKQAIVETGWLNCKVCSLNFNNLFGFRLAELITDNNPKGYISFTNWKESVKYYEWWQSKLYKGGDYYIFLKNIGFAEAPGYITLLKKIDYVSKLTKDPASGSSNNNCN